MVLRFDELPEHWQKQAASQIGNTRKDANLERSSGDGLAQEEKGARLDSPVYILCHHYRTRLADIENLQCKYCIDTVVKRGLLPDDRPQYVVKVDHQQTKVKTKEDERTVIELISVNTF